MFAAVIRLSTAIVLIVGAANAGQYDHIFTVSPDKDSKCHSPLIKDCNSSLYPILDYQIAAWFFHPPFKSCRPLYTAGGVHNCTNNQDLPADRSECENLCGEPCTMDDGQVGICTLEEHCKNTVSKPSAHPRPCGAYGVKCCTRRAAAAAPAAAVKSGVKSSAVPPVASNSIAYLGYISDRFHHQRISPKAHH